MTGCMLVLKNIYVWASLVITLFKVLVPCDSVGLKIQSMWIFSIKGEEGGQANRIRPKVLETDDNVEHSWEVQGQYFPDCLGRIDYSRGTRDSVAWRPRGGLRWLQSSSTVQYSWQGWCGSCGGILLTFSGLQVQCLQLLLVLKLLQFVLIQSY